MAKLAAEQSSKEALSEEITGPLGFVLTNSLLRLQVLFKYAEDNEIDFIVKKGLVNNDLLDEGTLQKTF